MVDHIKVSGECEHCNYVGEVNEVRTVPEFNPVTNAYESDTLGYVCDSCITKWFM